MKKTFSEGTGLIFAGLIILVFFGQMFYLSYERINKQEIGIWEGYMSFVPITYLSINYTPAKPSVGSSFKIQPLLCDRFNGCVVCENCKVDIYNEIDGQRYPEIMALNFINQSEQQITFKTDPTWAFIYWEEINTGGWTRIPEPSFIQTVLIQFRGWQNWADPIGLIGSSLGIMMFIFGATKYLYKKYKLLRFNKS